MGLSMLIPVVVDEVFRVGTAHFSVEVMGGNAIRPVILAAEDAESLAAVSVEIFQRFKKCLGEVSGYGQVLNSCVLG